MSGPEICFILYRPAVPGNIGAAARAIKTMGFDRLRLINPADHLCDEARMLAHGSHDVLENSKVYASFPDAVADIDFIICTTAKKKSAKVDYISSVDLRRFLSEKFPVTRRIGIVFGTEESGLPNSILLAANVGVTIPMATTHPSLNLAQSVMVIAYEISALLRGEEIGREDENMAGIRSSDSDGDSIRGSEVDSGDDSYSKASGERNRERSIDKKGSGGNAASIRNAGSRGNGNSRSNAGSGGNAGTGGNADSRSNTGSGRNAGSGGTGMGPGSTGHQHPEAWKQLQDRTSKILQQSGIQPGTPLYHRIMERMSFLNASDARLAHSVTSKVKELIDRLTRK